MLKKKLSLILILAASVYITACCSCGAGEDNVVKGTIVSVGHEPFTKVGLRITDDKIYTLKCSKELEKELLQNQGNLYAIQFSESITEEGLPVLVVEKATPIKETNDEK